MSVWNFMNGLVGDINSVEFAGKKDPVDFNVAPYFFEELNLDRIKELNSKYKIVIKPSDSCASRGITILDKKSSDEELKKAFEKAHDLTTNDFVNIEEFVDGTEFTVEMLGDDYGNVAVFGISKKYHTENALNNKVAVKLEDGKIKDYTKDEIEMIDDDVNNIDISGTNVFQDMVDDANEDMSHLEDKE